MQESRFYKLEIYVPETHFEEMKDALRAAGAGRIGNYELCLAVSKITGMWTPLEGSNPYTGTAGEECVAQDLRIDVRVDADALKETLRAIYAAHPYEEPLVHVIPLLDPKGLCADIRAVAFDGR